MYGKAFFESVFAFVSIPSFKAASTLLLLGLCTSTTSFAFDYTLGEVRYDPLRVMPPALGNTVSQSGSRACAELEQPADSALTLSVVVSRALCHNPKSREAWAAMRGQAAQVGVAQAAYLPTLSATGQAVRDRARSSGNNSIGRPFDFSALSSNRSASVNLGWVLYDFGLRSANLDSAEQTLLSALAKQDATLQTIITTTVKDYYAAQIAQKNIIATRQFEANALQVLDMTRGRVKGGVAAISDQMQAQTDYSQALYNSTKADGDWQTALGTLAVDMGAPPTLHYRLSDGDESAAAIQLQSVDDMLRVAEQNHPSLRAARADLAAAQAYERSIRAQGRPSLSLIGQYNTSKQAESPGGGQPFIETQRNDRYIGIKLDVPLFEGFGRTYKVRGAEAQTAEKAASVDEASLAVAVSVWSSYQQLRVSSTNIQTAQQIVDSAKQSLDAAQSRYLHGVTDIRELTTAQNTFADATRQQIKAVADWHYARIQLAASVGQLDLTQIQ
jgi:outer membrane protein